MERTHTQAITDITRRDIRRALLREGICWSGDLDERNFLSRLYDLDSLPSKEGRFENAANDIWQYRIINNDWDDSWVFSDKRFQLQSGSDEVLLQFLAEMVHPLVREDRDEARQIVKMLNELLEPDGWHLVETSSISGRTIYGARRLTSSRHAVSSATVVAEKVDADYLHRQINRMTSAIETDPDLAIGTAKELVETIARTISESRGKPVNGKPDLLPLVRLVLDELKLLPDGIADEVKGERSIKAILGNLTTIVQGLAELRNLYGTGHGKSGTAKGLTPRHARLAVGMASTLAVFLLETHEVRPMET